MTDIQATTTVTGTLSEVGDNADGEPTIWLEEAGSYRTTKMLCRAAAALGLGNVIRLDIADGLCVGVRSNG